ncbi:MAG: YfgM family protein [Leptothrix sp. (in: b-proteobacteria)]
MASHLDLEEQEQLDQIKAFWRAYGNLITWVLVGVLAAYAGWNAWQYWQRDQSSKAAGMYDEVERAVIAGDAERAAKVFADLSARYPRTAFAEQAGLITAKVQVDKAQNDAAKTTLGWVAEHATETEYRASARLRLAGLLMEAKQYDEALKQLAAAVPPSFEGLVADRRGDILFAQGKKAEAVTAYEQAYKAIDPVVDYRRVVEAKLIALGAAAVVDALAPAAAASAASPNAAASGAQP